MEATFCIIDLAGFTALTEAHGDTAAANLAGRFTELVTEALGDEDRLLKTMGDAVLVVASGPESAIAFTSRLCERMAIEPEFPVLRAGLHHGEAVERDSDVFGAAVNTAARIAAQATSGQVLASAHVADAGRRRGITVASLGQITLRNLRQPIELFALSLCTRQTPTAVDPVCRMRVDVESAAGRFRFECTDYYFCSLRCARLFAETPRAYTGAGRAVAPVGQEATEPSLRDPVGLIRRMLAHVTRPRSGTTARHLPQQSEHAVPPLSDFRDTDTSSIDRRSAPVRALPLDLLRCPVCRGDLTLPAAPPDAPLVCAGCQRRWPVRHGVPELVFPERLQGQDASAHALWERMARGYDAIRRLTSLMRGIDAREERRALLAGLALRPADTVLELATGTGHNLTLIADALGGSGRVVGLDLSTAMLDRARRKLSGGPHPVTLVRSNAMALPFADGVFDVVLDGFGSKYYSDKHRAVGEMLRVVKPGGTVTIAELGLPPDEPRTLRQRLLRLWIPGFDHGPPLDAVPADVRDLKLAWDRHRTGYTLQFRR